MKTVNNHKMIVIGKKDVTTVYTALGNITDASTTATVASPATILAGDLVITREDGAIVDSGTTGLDTYTGKLYVVQGQGANSPLVRSAAINKSGIKTKRGLLYSTPVQQVDYIGYNPVAGANYFELASAGTTLIVRNTFKSNFYQFSDKAIQSIVGYTVKSADTQTDVVTALTKGLIIDVQRYVNIPYAVERVNSVGTGTTELGASCVATFGSAQVICPTLGTLAVGDYVRFGTVTDETAGVYKVTSLNTGSFTLDTAFQGVTGTFTAANASVVVPVTTSLTNTGWGIRLRGLPQKLWQEGVFRYEISKWISTVENAGGTTVASPYTVGAEGSGSYYQIAEEEWFCLWAQGLGSSAYQQIPNLTFVKNAVSTGEYSMLCLEWSDVAGGTDVINNPIVYKQLNIAVDELTRTNQLNYLANTLDFWFGSVII